MKEFSHRPTDAQSEKGEIPAIKATMMPNQEEMITRLEGTGVLGVTPQTDAFYRNFVDQVADTQKAGAGLHMAWTLASYDTLRDLPPVISAVVDMNFDRVVDAVTPDLEVADQAKQFRQEVLETLRREQGQK